MNVALIFAGGVGRRMSSVSKPKQFLELHGKPIIIYTLEVFQAHQDIDAICVACVSEYIDYLKLLLDKYHITKVKWVVPGGETGQLSIYNGLAKLAENFSGDKDIVLIHDGVRPLIDEALIERNIKGVRANGNVISCAVATETIVSVRDDSSIETVSERRKSQIAKAPQSFYLKDIFDAHKRALADQQRDFIDSATLMRHYGYNLYTVECGTENIKITTPSDFYIFRAIVDAKENSQIFGI